MSATYNWAYKPGITNKYGIVVNASADNVKPDNACYVALFGNDSSGNGSRELPYKTLTKACTIIGNGTYLIIGSGVYRELAPITNLQGVSLIGDGDVTIDLSYITYLTPGGYYYSQTVANLTFRGNGYSSSLVISQQYLENTLFSDVVFDGCGVINDNGSQNNFASCTFKNHSGKLLLNQQSGNKITNCTFYNCTDIWFQDENVTYDALIFHTCNISSQDYTRIQKVQYTLFFQCNFSLNGLGNGGVLYPSVPSGYTYYSTIDDLRAAFYALSGSQGFIGCNVADPLFNNLAIGDSSLQFASPAKNLSYFGTYVGAKSIAYSVKASVTEANGSFDFSTNQNLNIAEDSITLVDTTQNASIQTTLIVNASGRQLQRIPIYGFNADRNGQYVDSIADLATSVKNAGDTLTVPTPYLVETGAITYNETVYQPGDRLTTLAGEVSFTTSVSGTLREILEAPERHTIMARFSDGDGTIAAGTALTVNYWYYVQTGSINYNSIVYNAGAGFKAVDSNSFNGSGTVILALSTEAFQHYEPGIQPTSNNAGDSRTGAIIRGNGDPAYVRGGYGITEFPINAKFIQLYYIINVNNLKP